MCHPRVVWGCCICSLCSSVHTLTPGKRSIGLGAEICLPAAAECSQKSCDNTASSQVELEDSLCHALDSSRLGWGKHRKMIISILREITITHYTLNFFHCITFTFFLGGGVGIAYHLTLLFSKHLPFEKLFNALISHFYPYLVETNVSAFLFPPPYFLTSSLPSIPNSTYFCPILYTSMTWTKLQWKHTWRHSGQLVSMPASQYRGQAFE